MIPLKFVTRHMYEALASMKPGESRTFAHIDEVVNMDEWDDLEKGDYLAICNGQEDPITCKFGGYRTSSMYPSFLEVIRA